MIFFYKVNYVASVNTHIMAKIMIIGDSWACGERDWRISDEGEMHGGTRQYLQEAGHDVISVAAGGASNWSQLDRIAPHHAYQRDRHSGHHLADADVIVWFLTDPLRDLIKSECEVDQARFDLTGSERQPRTIDAYHHVHDHLLAESMRRMAELVHDRPVLLVGGVCDVPTWVESIYPQWRVVVRDWVRWLIPQTRVNTVHLNRSWHFPDCDPKLLEFHEQAEEEAMLFKWRAEHRFRSLEHMYWWPDGRHPNRLAHERLTRELLLPLLKD